MHLRTLHFLFVIVWTDVLVDVGLVDEERCIGPQDLQISHRLIFSLESKIHIDRPQNWHDLKNIITLEILNVTPEMIGIVEEATHLPSGRWLTIRKFNLGKKQFLFVK